MRRPPGFGGAAAAAAAAASLTLGEFRAGQLSLFLTLAVLAVSLDLVWGYCGILSLGLCPWPRTWRWRPGAWRRHHGG